jgi:hypothetical protein
MNAMAISWIAFACIFGGAFLGMLLRNRLPDHHLSGDTKDVVRLGTGLIAHPLRACPRVADRLGEQHV